jgi:hypothetical protein
VNLRIANKFQRREVKKPCDHALTINHLETILKSKENEYNNLQAEFTAQNNDLDTKLFEKNG